MDVKQLGMVLLLEHGSVVTKDVEPYTIVAGNPAHIIGRRFEEKEIEELLEESKWYDLPIEKLKKYVNYSKDPKKFATQIIKDYKQEQ